MWIWLIALYGTQLGAERVAHGASLSLSLLACCRLCTQILYWLAAALHLSWVDVVVLALIGKWSDRNPVCDHPLLLASH